MTVGGNLHPVCIYIHEEVRGEYALKNTSLKILGLTSGRAVIRYVIVWSLGSQYIY